ncbi:SDR family NAD(P)-dependent oxidoreductase, partial [Asticcacaulis biprosthecium]|uniref:SDR family NAD(P)-dependent oxidoreductase n=1 Tax=Asticcacaulis biprosthecium TaxID=76891 RepID=UPI0012F51D74
MTKRALVTGAAKRIGRAIAVALARQGYDIAVHYNRSRDDALDLVAELEAIGVHAAPVGCDLSQPACVTNLVGDAVKALGPLHVLVNNASIFADDRAATVTVDSFTTHTNTNLLAPILLSQAFAAQTELPEG